MARIHKRKTAVVLGAAAALTLSACGSGSGSGSSGGGSGAKASGTVNYWLWEAAQLPGYQACGRAFEAKNPNIKVKISQYGWDDYWNKLTTSMVSGTAPDVFTDHLSKYPEFVTKGQIVPLDDMIKKENVPTDIYVNGLADLWVGKDGKRYGLPKDWDTISVFYNKKMLKDAGISEKQMQSLTWNPQDGGSYEKVIAHLTVDKNGKRGDQPGFDKNNVKVYGLGLESSGGNNAGQGQWSMYAAANGWQSTNKKVWGDHYNYDDPKLQQTIEWWRGLIQKGYMNPLKSTVGVTPDTQMGAGKFALSTNGSWTIKAYYGQKGVQIGTAPTPVGPTGKRASMFNGLADSIFSGSKKKAAAFEWLKFLASPECEKIIGQQGVVFPATKDGVAAAEKAFQAKGVDTSSFTVHIKEGTTFLFPVTDHAADVGAILQPAMDAVLSFKAPVSSLTQANQKVNALFQ
jgi:multiple sugar transport system substrate-binding protein